jgi:ATP-dependent DNA helicase RecQ
VSAPDVLRSVFGFPSFRPGQEAVIERLLAGRSALAIFPTGGGKSLCYQVPALLLEGITIVISPLIALMKDQVDALRRKGVAAAHLDSSLEASEVAKIYEQLSSGSLRLLYVAPERLANERFVNRLRQLAIPLLAIDEAHCISEWGHNFRPDYLKIARIARELRVGRVLALTATATPAVAADIRRAFAIEPGDQVQTGFYRPNLDLEVTPCTARERPDLLAARFRDGAGPAIVYVTLQRTAEEVALRLARDGIAAAAYHAGLETERRTAVQDAFMSGATRVVVATIAFGMGIDKADIRAIYHYNIPKTLENYVQEIGRAGRDGLPSRCEVLACGDDRTVLENFTYGDTPSTARLGALVHEVLGAGERFDVSLHDLSTEHDIRPLVVTTALTYLELDGTLAHVAPFYTEYKLQLLKPEAEIVGRYDPERRAFLGSVLAAGKQGRVWRTLVLADAARDLGQPRERIVAALGYLEERGDLVVQVSGLRQGYRRLQAPADEGALIARLDGLFQKREERDIERMGGVLRFLEHGGCLARALLTYFGEDLPADCGHCTSCRKPGPRPIPRSASRALGKAEAETLRELRSEGHAALRDPRAMARFLCGITSPAATRARLGRDPRFGSWSDAAFPEVLRLVQA